MVQKGYEMDRLEQTLLWLTQVASNLHLFATHWYYPHSLLDEMEENDSWWPPHGHCQICNGHLGLWHSRLSVRLLYDHQEMEVFHWAQVYCRHSFLFPSVNVLGSLLPATKRPWCHCCRFQETNYRMAPRDLPLHLPILFGRLHNQYHHVLPNRRYGKKG